MYTMQFIDGSLGHVNDNGCWDYLAPDGHFETGLSNSHDEARLAVLKIHNVRLFIKQQQEQMNFYSQLLNRYSPIQGRNHETNYQMF